MPDLFILTAVTMEARSLARVGLAAVPIGIAGRRLGQSKRPGPDDWVIVAGVGGAIDPSLAVGDVVVDGPPEVVPSGCRRGTIHTVDRVLSTPAGKAAAFAATKAAVVDMEQAVVRRWAGRPVVGVRAVSDAATDAIDPAVVRFVTDLGRPRPGVIAATLLRRPGLIPSLSRLSRDTTTALARLGPAVRAVADRLSGQPT